MKRKDVEIMARMTGRFLKNMVKVLLLMLAVSIIAFTLMSLSPVDPVERYVRWLWAVLQGDLGQSLLYRRPVAEIIGERFLNSPALMACAWVFSGVIGFLFGCLMGMYRDRWPDRILKKICYLLASVPTFWLGLLLLLVFSAGGSLWGSPLPSGYSTLK